MSDQNMIDENKIDENKMDENTPSISEEELLALAQKEGLTEQLPLAGMAGEFSDSQSAEGANDGTVESSAPVDPLANITVATQHELTASMETILFMSDKPVSLPKLRALLNQEIPLAAYRILLTRLREEYAQDYRGIEIAEVSLGFQLRTKPHMSSVLRKMVKTQPLKLTPATMEVLTVVAYKQPLTKDEIDQIRGVDSSYLLRNLMEKHLVKIMGRSELPGRPILYGTTHEFLELFSLKDLKHLPPLHEIESMVASSEIGIEQQEQAQFQEFAKMIEADPTPLFEEKGLDEELEIIRTEIAKIPTSTPFIEEQKAAEKAAAAALLLAQNSVAASDAAAATELRHAEMLTATIQQTDVGNVATMAATPTELELKPVPEPTKEITNEQ